MTKYFVYRTVNNRWWISFKNPGSEWQPLRDFDTWRAAFDFAFRLARHDRNRYRWTPVTVLTP
ncbi:hypothetical protein [Nocardia asiatica]